METTSPSVAEVKRGFLNNLFEMKMLFEFNVTVHEFPEALDITVLILVLSDPNIFQSSDSQSIN